ncbi:MAG: hypothetical protein ACOC1N_02875 [Bacillota bacterium]
MDKDLNNENNHNLISYVNYKDILIVLAAWYIMALIILITRELNLKHNILTGIFHFLFIVSGRFIFLAAVLFYFNSLYSISFHELGFKFKSFFSNISKTSSLFFLLFALTILLINTPLSFMENSNFSPLFKIVGPNSFVTSLFPFLLLYIGCYVVGLAEQFLLNIVIFELFNNTIFNFVISLILAGLFYSIIIMNLDPAKILINFIAAIISIIIYNRNKSIIYSTIFTAGYYACFISYIYGWEFLRF